ncbi:hypothetical protein [Paucihalobacter sp.]|uniref:hypothetical protein n=1 Tax=Paucihalobacter sp. TaxID=2850405 RepID=UPI002FE2FECD
MKTLKNPYFLLLLFVAILIYSAKRFKIDIPDWISFYFYDFLCMPIVLTIILALIRFLKKDASVKIPLFAIVSLTVYYAWFFEWLMPKYDPRYTGDWLDVLMYFLGSSLFYFSERKQII